MAVQAMGRTRGRRENKRGEGEKKQRREACREEEGEVEEESGRGDGGREWEGVEELIVAATG